LQSPALLSTSLSQSVPLGLSPADLPEGLVIPDAPVAEISPPVRDLAVHPPVPEEFQLQMLALRPRSHLHHHLNHQPCLLKHWQCHQQEKLEANGVDLVGPIHHTQ
jgi:hypothetical protein